MKLSQFLVATTLSATTLGLIASSTPTSAIEVSQTVAQTEDEPAQLAPPAQRPAASPRRTAPAYRTIWHEGQRLRQEADWVESTFSVEEEGRRLILAVQGSVEIQSAQVQLADGQVQPLQVRRQPYRNGEYLLLNFGDNQYVQSIQVVGRTNLPRAEYSVELRN